MDIKMDKLEKELKPGHHKVLHISQIYEDRK